MEATHTPGPWKIIAMRANGEIPLVATATRLVVATAVDSGTIQETQANARLIAASPARLEALKAIAGMVVVEDTDHRQLLALCMHIARQAIRN
jgi:hypothetical protein